MRLSVSCKKQEQTSIFLMMFIKMQKIHSASWPSQRRLLRFFKIKNQVY